MTTDADRVDVPGYEILGLIGRGGMGVVHRARQVALDRVVALKTIPATFRDHAAVAARFEREARAVGRLSHPHIVAAHDFGRHDGCLFLAMEFVAGEDAQSLVDTRGCLDEWTAWGIVRQAASALDHASRQGLVHRDVKPANLLLSTPPAGFPLPVGMPLVKVVDFGLARLVEAAEDEPRLTQANRILGTPHYMAPEQLLGGEVGPQADIYALGATAYCLLAGRPPLAGRAMPQIIAAHVGRGQGRDTFRPLRDARPGVSDESAALIEAMMAHDPARRIADYVDLLRRIDGLPLVSAADTATGEFTQPTTRGDPQATRGRSLTGRVWPAGIALLLLGPVVWAVVPRRPAVLERTHVPSGIAADLFDGGSLAPWRTVHGSWAIGRNDEGAIVLEGTGLVRRPLSLPDAHGARGVPEQYRLSCLVDRAAATAAEIQFDLPAGDGATDPARLVVRIERGAVVCGRQTDPAGSVNAIVRRAVDDGRPLHAVEIERQQASWWITVDGERLAVVPCLRRRAAGEFALGASGGEARFSDITLEQLVPPPTTAGPTDGPAG